ncbi:hypothetical protein [Psychrobacter jeotgali]|uniref:hypothetical protein n=1 Tax=Psychrobacter jeotgali TaxID=179010 RepID=UPI0019198AB2|nr:hypothetical protein [Psychrobacter jeotgali]
MKEINYKDWTLIVDVEATKRFYAKQPIGSAEACGCYNCQNFVANGDSIYPNEIKDLFSQLGIDYTKDNEASYIGHHEGVYWYFGWFFYCGKLIGKDSRVQLDDGTSTVETVPVDDKFSIGFCRTGVYLAQDNDKFIQIEVFVELPWVIDKELDIN